MVGPGTILGKQLLWLFKNDFYFGREKNLGYLGFGFSTNQTKDFHGVTWPALPDVWILRLLPAKMFNVQGFQNLLQHYSDFFIKI